MPDTIIPFSDIVAQTKDNPVFRAAGISKAAPVEIPFSEIQKSESSSPEISLDQVANVDRFPRSTKEELFKDDSFDPRSYFNENPDIAQDPKQLEKLVEVYRARRERGVTLGAVGEAVKSAPSTAEKFVKGAANLASNVLEFSGVQPLINKGLGVLTGDAFDTKKSEALDKASQDRAKKAFSEFEAGSELSATGISDLGRTGARKIFGKSPSKMTHQELLADLAEDAAFQNQIKAVSEGRGESLKNAGLDADTLAKDGIVLDPQAIENLSLVDPATVLATAGGFKIVGALGKPLATAATRDAAAAVASKLNGLAETAVKKVGEGISKVGEVSQKAGAGATALRNNARGTATVLGATQVGAGSTLTGSGIIAASRLAPAALNFAGRQLTNVGEQIAGNAPRSGLIGKVLDISTSSPVKGAAAGGAVGAATAAPLALAADDDKAAGAILGGGLALGAAAGAGIGTARAIGEFASTKAFDPHGKSLPVVDSPAYGIDPGLDAIHTAQIEKLPVKDRGVVTNFREAVRNLGGEIYATDQGTFRQQLIDQAVRDLNRDLTAPELAQIDEASQHLGMFDANLPGGPNGSRRVVFLNDSAKAAPHEAGHLFESLVSPETRQGLYDAVKQFYTPEQILAFKTNYENRLGSKVTEERILGEIVAENFSAIFNNVPVTELTAPRGFLAKLGTTLAQGAEALGLDLTVGRTTPDLQAPASHQLREYFRNAATEVVKASDAAPPPPPNLTVLPPPPGGPTIPTGPSTPPVLRVLPPPTASAPAAPRAPARNIRVTQAQQDAFARRSADTGVPAAKELAARDADPAVAQRVTEISASMEAGNPVLEIEHLGIASESTPEALLGRTARRGEQAPGYAELEALRVENRANAPASVVNTHQKTFVPVRWTDQGGTPTLVAMSLDKVISNIHRIADAAADKNASSLLPYPSENGKLTEAGWTQAVADAQAYAENQSNGFRGDGRRLTRPTEDVGLSIPAENPEYRPQLLDENVANFQNLIQGLATPVTAREVKGLTPGNIKGQVLAEANKRPLLTPADITPKNAGKQNFKSFPGRSLKEVNPLRNELAARGVNVRDLIEVTERIRAKDIASVKPREDINFKAPVTDIIRAGFLPKENESIQDFGKRVIASSQEEWKRITEEGGSLTKSAYDIGLHDIKTPEDLAALKSLQQEVSTMAKQAIAEGDLDKGFPLVTKAQYFREAYEAATDTASAAGPNGWRKYFTNDVPPFKGGAPNVSFLPKTKSGEALEKKGYVIKANGQVGVRGVEIFDKNRDLVGEIISSQVKPGEANIANVLVKKPARGTGIGEALYRELGAQLKEDGVTKVTGDVVAPEPLGIRRKVFGEFSDLKVNGESAPFEDAAAASKIVQKGIQTYHIEPTNRITPDHQFLPAEELQSEQQPDLKIVPKSAGESPREIPAPLPVTARQPKETVAPNIKTPAQAAALASRVAFLPGEEQDKALRAGLVEDLKPARPSPSTPIRNVARDYADEAGIPYTPTQDYAPLNKDLGRKLADFYDTAESTPEAPAVRKSYDALIKETEAQGKAIEAAGYTAEPWTGEGEPYKSSADMVNDVRENKHLYYLQTEKQFGTGTGKEAGANPMLAESEAFPGQKANDVFRWVHDFFGHAKEGFQFGPRGEFNAWRAHSEMFSPEAQGALAAETLAQNSWVNFGKHLDGKDVPVTERPFAEQKNTVVPQELIDEARNQFLPAKRNAQGQPMTREGLVDYEKLYKELSAANKKRQTESDKSLTISAKSPKGVAKASATPVKLTGWVLPNKEFVPLDTNFHEQYLADNAADLNKRFGTTFDTEANPDARLDALNSGFVRFRYDNNGTLHVEANASKWPRAKSKVLSQLVDNEGRIDRIQASLLNDKGQVVDSVNERVFDLEGTDKVAKITDSINSLRPRRGPAFLPKDELPGFETDTAAESPEQFLKEKTARFRKENPEAILPQYAHDENGKLALGSNGKPKPVAINYNFADTPLVKTAAKGLKGESRNAKAAEVLGDELVKVYNKAVKNPDIEAGSKWYSTARTRLRKVLGDDSKLFAELLGATSARTAVDVNFKFAVEAYNQFKSGAFDDILAKYREGKQAFDQGDIADFVKDTGNAEPNRGQFLSWWIEKNNLGPLQSNGKKFGMNSIPVLKVLDGSWASEVKGPKTPNFTGNLTGETFEATVDVWAARLLHRLGNKGNEGRWRILPENETGVTDEDFYLGQAAFRHAAEKLGVKPDSLQAILWFAEKDFYEKAGWTRSTIGSGKTDFNVLLKRTEKTPSGKLKVTSEGGQKELIGPNFLPSGEYWMDSGGKFIKAAHGHLIEAEKILGVTNDSETARREVYPQMYAKGYTRIVSSQDGIYVDSEKARFSDLSSAQRAGIEDALLSNGPDAPLQELTFNGRRIEFDIP